MSFERSYPVTEVIVDASSLIALGKIGFLETFAELCKHQGWTVVITKQVLQEIRNTIAGSTLEQIAIYHDAVVSEAFRQAHIALGEGELSVLCSAQELHHFPDPVAVVDEELARKSAKRLGVSVIGTLRILRLALDSALISRAECDRLIGELATTGFRFDPRLLRDLF